jgi:hypothetical protein
MILPGIGTANAAGRNPKRSESEREPEKVHNGV